jgi:hypothetical protein
LKILKKEHVPTISASSSSSKPSRGSKPSPFVHADEVHYIANSTHTPRRPTHASSHESGNSHGGVSNGGSSHESLGDGRRPTNSANSFESSGDSLRRPTIGANSFESLGDSPRRPTGGASSYENGDSPRRPTHGGGSYENSDDTPIRRPTNGGGSYESSGPTRRPTIGGSNSYDSGETPRRPSSGGNSYESPGPNGIEYPPDGEYASSGEVTTTSNPPNFATTGRPTTSGSGKRFFLSVCGFLILGESMSFAPKWILKPLYFYKKALLGVVFVFHFPIAALLALGRGFGSRSGRILS